ncbi:MAG: translocation/assembly module TamB domain-containing protein [Pyrinomonadaceae bacterium]|nr:translocation/assembly module TamB domain-containing protein [Pyrinomonadaceae bacterium]
MSEENDNQIEEVRTPEENAAETTAPETAVRRRRIFSRRNAGISFGLIALAAIFLALLTVVVYRYGYADNYVKNQFVAKMDEIGVNFSADTFRLTVAPLQLELKNATFNDKITGEKLFFIRDAKLGLTIKDLYAWQLSRDISIDTTDIDGAEVWVKFDENGKSNFSNLKFIEDEAGSRVNFTYTSLTSLKFSLKNGLVHFGDVTRKINADAKNIALMLEPENYDVPDEQKRYKFNFNSTDSNFIYDESIVQPVDIRAAGIVDKLGAEINDLKLTTPLGESNLSGTLSDWAALKYNLNIASTVDLQQTASIFPLGTPLRGFGNFSGTVVGEGAKYKIVGEVKSDALEASNIRLKGLNVAATVNGENSMYDINGKAVAELLTFEDFQIDFPQLIGNVRGTGTDFKWVGELQAVAAKTPAGTIAGLFISDAVAEYKDNQLDGTLGNVRARKFSSEDVELQTVLAQNVKISNADGTTIVTAPNLRAGMVNAEGATLRGVNAGNVKITNRGDRTDVKADTLRAENVETEDVRLRNLRANNIGVTNNGNRTDVKIGQANADGLEANGTKIGNLTANGVDVQIVGNETEIYSDNLRVAKIETDAAILGSLNVGGVRLTIRQGRIEARSGDIDAGTIALTKSVLPEGGNVEKVVIYKPVFVLEPSGRYRASADLSLGGGVLGSVKLGAARASVVAENEQVALTNLTADVMDGTINGEATIALNNRRRSQVNANFSNLDLSKLLALQGGKVVPIEGKTTGNVNVNFAGTNFKTASGTLTADFAANAGTAERGLVPVNGRLGLKATNGLFDVDFANLKTEKSELNATGSFDLNGYNSNLNVALNSTDASEIERIIRVLNISPELEAQLDEYKATFAGNLNFNGNITGNLTNPTVDGRAAVDSISLRGRNLGSLTTNVFVSPNAIELRDGKLQEPNGGGNLAFNVSVPSVGENNISVQATLNNINTGNLLAALPVDVLPEQLKDFQAVTSGTVNVSGIPGNLQGEANVSSGKGTINGEAFDGFDAKATFAGTLVNIEKFEAKFGEGFLRANGTYETNLKNFDFNVEGKNIQFARVRPFISTAAALKDISGTIDLTAKATGNAADSKTYNINFNGIGRNVVAGDNALGEITFVGTTENQQLNASVTVNVGGQAQILAANVNFADENLPFKAETIFNNTDLAPYIAFVRSSDEIPITGRATGRVFLQGNLYAVKADGTRGFTTDNLAGAAEFSQLALQIDQTPLEATEPVSVTFNSREIVVNSAKFAGGGSNIVVNGTAALADGGTNNLAIDGRVNLSILNAISKNTFVAGLANVSVRLTGDNAAPRLNGTAELEGASVATFLGADRLTLDRIRGRVLFNTNQVQIDRLTGFLGGGRVTASGGALLKGLDLQSFRFEVQGTNFTAPVPSDFITTGDAEIEFSGVRRDGILESLIAGTIYTRRTIYNKDIDIADFVSGRRSGSLSESSSGNSSGSYFGVPKLDVRIEGRDALIVRNNIADLTASASLRVTGDVEYPQISGRITANSGTILFRGDRYEIQRATLEFPPNTSIEPLINLQAETEIKGYQIIINLNGELTNTDNLNATVRSNPALPQADVVSLITTGNLANTDTGIPTLAQSGINTAAEILTDELINNPLSRATDKLFGLNRFELDPSIGGQRLNPSARLTVGRQINRNLLITYSTNLSEDQNQVLALEYRVSNRLSFVAQYEQRSLSNVTRRNNNFSFDIRLRKRF